MFLRILTALSLRRKEFKIDILKEHFHLFTCLITNALSNVTSRVLETAVFGTWETILDLMLKIWRVIFGDRKVIHQIHQNLAPPKFSAIR